MRWVSTKECYPSKDGEYLVKIYDPTAKESTRYERLAFGGRMNTIRWTKHVQEWLNEETSQNIAAYEYYSALHILIRLLAQIQHRTLFTEEDSIRKLMKEFKNVFPKQFDTYILREQPREFMCEKEDFEHDKCLLQCEPCINKYSVDKK